MQGNIWKKMAKKRKKKKERKKMHSAVFELSRLTVIAINLWEIFLCTGVARARRIKINIRETCDKILDRCTRTGVDCRKMFTTGDTIEYCTS
ncbi:hypothetical protein CEXT_354061 [Caerostris extrusa]|uniref:Uncharacterized protein n=1 Tax=Caerostris extrusa TaxID=172846 RepID=A0AAV4PYD2_CAEEX|nr:hypothetical protein CEXT_354061 [Caerostris extrusa]